MSMLQAMISQAYVCFNKAKKTFQNETLAASSNGTS